MAIRIEEETLMTKPVINIADIELKPRPAALAPFGPDGKPQRFVFIARESDSRDYREGE